MNKKNKTISLLICGLAVVSNLALTNVYASSGDTKSKGDIVIKSIINNQNYKHYAYINQNAQYAVVKYIRKNTTSSTATGIRDTLIQKGIDRQIANNISYSLYGLIYTYENPYPELVGYQNDGMIVLQATDGTYNLIDVMDRLNSSQDYSTYGVLSHDDLVLLKNGISSNIYGKNVDMLTKYIVQNNIISNQSDANKLAWAVFSEGDYQIGTLANSNQNILVLKGSIDGNFALARQSK